MKRRYFVVSMLVLLGLLVVACSNTETNENPANTSNGNEQKQEEQRTESGEQEEKENPYKLDKPQTITMMTNASEYNDDLLVYQYIQEATNIQIDGQYPAGNYSDAIALAMAGGDVPDIIYMNGNEQPKQYGSQGALIDFNEYLDQMPNLKAFWEEHPEIKNRATTYDGKTYQAITDGLGYTNHIVWMYRADIFEKHNLKAPSTWDELHTVLKELKQLYPDVYPFTFRDRLSNVDNNMLPSFGIYGNVHRELETREVVYGQVQEEYRDLLEYLNTFHEEKLINQDFLSITAQQWVEMMTTGRAFITVDYIGRMQSLTDAMEEEGARLEMMPPPAGNEGPAYVRYMNFMPGGFTVYKKSSNLEATLHYIDFLFSEEGSELVSWGKEGETYDEVDGSRQLIVGEETVDLRRKTGMGGFGSYGKFDSSATMTLLKDQYRPYYEEVLDYYYPEHPISPAFTDEQQQSLNLSYDGIVKHKDTMAARFILGDRPLTDWEKYVSEMENLGLLDVLEVYKKAWERMEK